MRLAGLFAFALVSLVGCGGAVGGDVQGPARDASAGDGQADATPPASDAPLFGSDDANASEAGDAADAADAKGGGTKCTSDADCASVPGAHTCCGGACVDTSRSLANCGACGKACTIAHGKGMCSSGACSIASCDAPFDDCDGNAADGCEVDTSSSASNCGACFHPCVPPNGTASCAGSACAIASCPSGLADCNHVFSDGCEANLATDPNNCGACGAHPAEVCNLQDDDCDGKCDDVAGCRVGVNRSLDASSGEHFYTTSASEAGCCGFTVQLAPAYYLYASSLPGLSPFYRCLLSTGFHFYTTSANCEGSPGATVEGTMGYIAGGATCGAVPLYRMVMGNDHFFTTSTSERDSALASGYSSEGLAGYVWTTPQG